MSQRQVWHIKDIRNHLPLQAYLGDAKSKHCGCVVRLEKIEGGYIIGEVVEDCKLIKHPFQKDAPDVLSRIPIPADVHLPIRYHVNNDKVTFFSLFPYSGTYQWIQ